MSYAHSFFDQISANSIARATENFNNSIKCMITPYYNLLSNLKAFGHPMCHAFQFFMDLGGFGQSLFGVIESLALGRLDGANRSFNHMGSFAAAAVLEMANIVLSVVSLAARFVATVLSFGYVSTRVQFCDALGFEVCAPDNVSVSEGLDTSTHQAAYRLVPFF